MSESVTFNSELYIASNPVQFNNLDFTPYSTPILISDGLEQIDIIIITGVDPTYDTFYDLQAYIILPNGKKQSLTITHYINTSLQNVIRVNTATTSIIGVNDVYISFLRKSAIPNLSVERIAYNILQQVAVVYETTEVTPNWTFVNAVKRILQSGKQRTSTQTQLYTLDTNMETEYADLLLPEMTLTKTNLWEALLTVCEPFNLLPRTICVNDNWYTITFDKKIPSEEATNNGTLISEQSIQSIDTYATSLDSNVSNVINIGTDGSKTMIEPGTQSINNAAPILAAKNTCN